jgi:hypothetical protein
VVWLKGVGEWAQKKFLAHHLQNEDVDLAIRSEGGSKQVVVEISFMSLSKTSPDRTAITLHEELAIPLPGAPTVRW